MIISRINKRLALAGLLACSALAWSALPLRVNAGGESAVVTSVDARTFPNLSTAKARIGRSQATIAITTPLAVNNLSIPPNIRLKVSGEGNIRVTGGKTIMIYGPFTAPIASVFTGPGAVMFGASSTRKVYPEWWGADDIRESALAIQKAIDSLTAGDVILSAKTYLLNRRVRMKLVDGSQDPVSAILVPKSRVNIIGQGNDSVLKITDDFTRGGDYVFFAPVNAESISDITFSAFRIDGNGARNLVIGVTAGQVRRAMAIWLFKGRNIRIDTVRFDNHPGTNVVKFGSDSLSYLVTDSIIENCTFSNVGGAIPGNRRQSDHSTIYVSGRNVTVKNNILSNPYPHDENGPPVAVVAGIEMHGDDMTVAGNRVENFSSAGYIVADGIVTAKHQQWLENRFVSMTKLGISIWSVSAVSDILIESNSIELNGVLDQAGAGIFQSLYPPDTTVGIDGITVRNNSIFGTGVKAGTVWNGIQFTAVKNAIIEGNVIERISGAGILIYGNPNRRIDCRNIDIRNNIVRDTGFNKYGAYPYAIDLTNNGLGKFEAISISGNLLENTLPLAGEMKGIGVQGKSPVAGVRIDGKNRFVHLKRRDYWVNDSGLKGSVTTDPPVQEH